jgi:hypothetical protein
VTLSTKASTRSDRRRRRRLTQMLLLLLVMRADADKSAPRFS